MSIRVLCERCGKSYDFKSEHIGKRFRCKGCDKVLEVKPLLSEFENIESDSNYIPLAKPVESESISKKVKSSFIVNTDEDAEEDTPEIKEEPVLPKPKKPKKVKAEKSGSAKSGNKEDELNAWEERLKINENAYETPGQLIVKMIWKNLTVVLISTFVIIFSVVGIFYLLVLFM